MCVYGTCTCKMFVWSCHRGKTIGSIIYTGTWRRFEKTLSTMQYGPPVSMVSVSPHWFPSVGKIAVTVVCFRIFGKGYRYVLHGIKFMKD